MLIFTSEVLVNCFFIPELTLGSFHIFPCSLSPHTNADMEMKPVVYLQNVLGVSGHVTDLKDVVVTQIALGKAHTVALTSKGQLFTFGINNKGQCGRDFTHAGVRESECCVCLRLPAC